MPDQDHRSSEGNFLMGLRQGHRRSFSSGTGHGSQPGKITGRDRNAMRQPGPRWRLAEGPGNVLDPETHKILAPLFAIDLSTIRLHTDDRATELTDALNADAVTHGHDVFLAPTRWVPHSAQGRALIAHEVVHALHQESIPAPGHTDEESDARHMEERARSLPGIPLRASAWQDQSKDRTEGFLQSGTLGRRASQLSRTRQSGGAPMPDVLSAQAGLVSLVTLLLRRDGNDASGRVRSLLNRVDGELRSAIVDEVEMQGGLMAAQLAEITTTREPSHEPAPTPETGAETELGNDTIGLTATTTQTEEDKTRTALGAETTAEPAADSVHKPLDPVEEVDTHAKDRGAVDPIATWGTDKPSVDGQDNGAETEPDPSPAELGTTASKQLGTGPEASPAIPRGAGVFTDAAGSAPTQGVPVGGVAEASVVPEDLLPSDLVEQGVVGQQTAAPSADMPGSEEVKAADKTAATPKELIFEDKATDLIEDPVDQTAEDTDGVAAVAAAGAAPPEIQAVAPEAVTPEPVANHSVEVASSESGSENAPEGQLLDIATDPQTTRPDAGIDSAGPWETPLGLEEVEKNPGLRAAAAPEQAGGLAVSLPDPRPPSGGGGGGGSAVPEPQRPTPPDMAGMAPAQAMSAVAGLPATMLAATLPAVGANAAAEVSAKGDDLQARPPSLRRPSGVPADRDATLPPAPLPSLQERPTPPLPETTGGPGAEPPTPAAPPAVPAAVTDGVGTVIVGGDTALSHEDVARVQSAVSALPTSDPALNMDAGPVPSLILSGAEEPEVIGEQTTQMRQLMTETAAEGVEDARAPMGENDVYPVVPDNTLTATIPAREGNGQGGTSGQGKGDTGTGSQATAIDAIVAEQSGTRLAAAVQSGRQDLTTARAEHETTVQEEQAATDRAINEEIITNGADQRETRAAVRAEVGGLRSDWVGEQQDLTTRSRTAADAAERTAAETISQARTSAAREADGAIRDGNSSINQERRRAEAEAREQRRRAENESNGGGFFSWVASKVRSFFNRIKDAIKATFDRARQLVNTAISKAQQLAVKAIEVGRHAVVGAIESGGRALTAAGDIALAGFPEAQARFRKGIQGAVRDATDRVNQLANALSKEVTRLLDLLGEALNAALSVLERVYLAAVDAVAGAVTAAINAARAVAAALGDFLVLVRDIAADPAGWLRNLSAGVMDGIRNHVWPALVTAVKTWFREKVEAIVGVGAAIMAVLRQGGVSFRDITGMAWTAIKESLPGVLIQILIEKLVAMLIPAAGAISVIVDGLRAAWGASQQILAAFRRFMEFLRSVRPGQAGLPFGQLVGAAAVAVIDFVSNFVLVRLRGAGSRVGGVLRSMAARLGRVVRRGAATVRRGASAVAGVARRGASAIAGAAQRGAVSLGKRARQLRHRFRRRTDTVPSRRREQRRADRVRVAFRRTREAVQRLAARGAGKAQWWANLKWLKTRYRWRVLKLRTSSATPSVHGELNPILDQAVRVSRDILSTTSTVIGRFETITVNQIITTEYGAKGGRYSSNAAEFEAFVTREIAQELLYDIEDFRDSVVFTGSVVSAGSGKREEKSNSSGKRFSTNDTVIPHIQKGTRDGGRTRPEVLVEAPGRNLTVVQEAQMPSNYSEVAPPGVDPWRWAENHGRKIEQFGDRLRKIGKRMSGGAFAKEVKRSGTASPPRIVVMIISPGEPHETGTVSGILKGVQKFAEERAGMPIFVDVRWVSTGRSAP
ncbi:DUF4157 domain-containing protein [Arthrobacter sp. B0490]|uniref:eCIS core domain-containing protein n=1 Tax=Arthrobacter sp. B0490 TaxID=2058891 RepID=UPI000CE4BC3E|nr:DUF4157 domain-containing protein [Arthrobacter sp. B0490]